MYLGLVKRNTKIKTSNINNTYRDYSGGLITNMKMANAYCVINNSNEYISKSLRILLNIWMYVRLFFKSFLWIYHVKVTVKGDIKTTETVDKTPEGVLIDSNISRTYSPNMKRVTYYIFRVIPILYFRTGLTEDEIKNLVK